MCKPILAPGHENAVHKRLCVKGAEFDARGRRQRKLRVGIAAAINSWGPADKSRDTKIGGK